MGDDDPVDDRDASSGDWHRDKGTENAAEGSATEGSDDNKCSRHGYGAGHDSRREYVGLYLQVGEQDGGNDDGRNQARLECDDGRDARSDDRPDNGDERTNKGDQR